MDLRAFCGWEIECKYWIRYFIYEDNTRQRAYYLEGFWGDDRLLSDYYYGKCFRQVILDPVELPEETFHIANRPKLVYPDEPNYEGRIVPLFAVFLVPREQWMLYKHLDPDEVTWEVKLLIDRSLFPE